MSNHQESGNQELSKIEVLSSEIEGSKGLTNFKTVSRSSSITSPSYRNTLDLPLIQDPRSINAANRAIEMLEKNVRFDSNALVSYHDQISSHDQAASFIAYVCMSSPRSPWCLPTDKKKDR